MKRRLLLFCTAIFLICFFSGCVVLPGNNTSDSDGSKIPGGSSVTTEPDGAESNDISLDALREEILQNGTFGAAFIGYVGYDSTGADLYDYLEYSATGQTYPFLSDATLCMAEGQELYVRMTYEKRGEAQ